MSAELPVNVPGGLLEQRLVGALRSWPFDVQPTGARSAALHMRLALECPLDQADHTQPDQPVGHAFRDRTFMPRGVRVEHIPPPRPEPVPA
jgi:hypothetical protein